VAFVTLDASAYRSVLSLFSAKSGLFHLFMTVSLDPEGGSQNATLVVLVVVISSL